MASAPTPLPLTASWTSCSVGGVTLSLVRLWAELAFESHLAILPNLHCLVDTGAPVCVVPYSVWQKHALVWQTLPGAWPKGLLSWMGVPCVLGRAEVWLPLPDAPFLRGPFPFIAKFAQSTPAGIAANMPILLGLNFLAVHRADTNFQCHTLPQAGTILIP